MTPNEKALLDTIAHSEGTIYIGQQNGYDVIVGSLPSKSIRMKDFSQHPDVLVQLNTTLFSTAAGRYQFIYETWTDLRRQLKLNDFGPNSQDDACLELIRQRGGLDLINAGEFEKAINAIANIWASLPGAGYNQHENSMDDLKAVYVAAGGTVNEAG